MPRCRVDESLERVVHGTFAFPLGVYPVEPISPREGYTVDFEPADEGGGGGDDEEWEDWPDRYVYDVLLSATRVESFVRRVFSIMPGRVYPILDVLGRDAYREVDPYVTYELVGQERMLDAMRRYRGFFFEDGLVGFGAMSEEPFFYVFVDEHKVVTIRAETSLRDRVEGILAAYELEEIDNILSADAVTHEHRTVLDAPDDRPDLLNVDEILEDLRDEWGLVLNIDPGSNVDDDGNDLGVTGWHCLVRHDPDPQNEGPLVPSRYADVLLTADCLNEAEDLAWEAATVLLGDPRQVSDEEAQLVVICADRLTPEEFESRVLDAGGGPVDFTEHRAWTSAWVV